MGFMLIWGHFSFYQAETDGKRKAMGWEQRRRFSAGFKLQTCLNPPSSSTYT